MFSLRGAPLAYGGPAALRRLPHRPTNGKDFLNRQVGSGTHFASLHATCPAVLRLTHSAARRALPERSKGWLNSVLVALGLSRARK